MKLFKSLGIIFYALYFSCSVVLCPAQAGSSYLAPASEVRQSGEILELEQAFSSASAYKQRVLNLDKTLKKEEVLNVLTEFPYLELEGRELYLQAREILSWWYFHDREIKQVLGESIQEDVLIYLEGLEENFSGQFQERFARYSDSLEIEWDENDFIFDEDDDSQFSYFFELAYERKEEINKWILSQGRLAQALHVIHNIPLNEIEQAFRENKIKLRAFPQGFGEYKYVLKLEVTLNGKNYYLAVKKIHTSEEVQSKEGVLNEIAATNMNRSFGLPVIGVSSADERIWIDQFILGDDLDKFILNLIIKYGLTEQQAVAIMKEVLNKAAKEFIYLFIRGFSGFYYVRDPHMGNVMAYWPKLHENQIDPANLNSDQIRLSLFDIGDLDPGFKTVADLPVNTVVVDVGQLNHSTENLFDFFEITYSSIYLYSEDKFRALLSRAYSEIKPTRAEFAEDVLNSLNDQEKIIFVSAVLQGVKKAISKRKERKKQLEISGLRTQAELIQSLIKDLEGVDYQMYLYVKNLLEESFKKSMALKENENLPAELVDKWGRASVLAQELNDEDLYDVANNYLKDLISGARSEKVRGFARQLLAKRTGNFPAPEIDLSPSSVEIDDSL